MPDNSSDRSGGREEDVLYDLAGNPLPPQPRRWPEPLLADPNNEPIPTPASSDPERNSKYYPAPGSGTPHPAPPPAKDALFAPIEPPPHVRQLKMIGLQVAIVIAVCLCALVVIVKLSRPHSLPKEMVTMPTFAVYTSADKAMIFDAPVGWKTKDDSVEGAMDGSAIFTRGNATIKVTDDAMGSIMSDINQVPPKTGPNGEEIAPPPPVIALHKKGEQAMEDAYNNYKEQLATSFQSLIGIARISEWTADDGDGKDKIHGYRATMLGPERSITTVCSCLEKNWAVLQPAFSHVIMSERPGKG